MKAGADVFLDRFTAAGAVQLPNADIAGALNCRAAQLTRADGDGNALTADRLKVGGDVVLDGGFRSAGAVRPTGAAIPRQLVCPAAHLPGTDAAGHPRHPDGTREGAHVLRNERCTPRRARR